MKSCDYWKIKSINELLLAKKENEFHLASARKELSTSFSSLRESLYPSRIFIHFIRNSLSWASRFYLYRQACLWAVSQLRQASKKKHATQEGSSAKEKR